MDIALARRGFSPSGGAEGYLRRLLHALAAAGHRTVLFGSPEWPQTGEWQPPGVFRSVSGRSPRAFADGLEAARRDGEEDVLFSLERVWRCDVFRAGDGVHRAWLERRDRAEPAWKRLVRRSFNAKHRQLLALETALLGLAGGARAVIANSSLVRDEILRVYGGSPERIHVIPNGLPAEAFAPVAPELRAATRRRLEVDGNAFVALFVGSGWERKGLRFALAAVDRLPGALRPCLVVAGAGGVPAGADGRTRFLGPVPAEDLSGLHAAADVFLLPTLYDPFSNACLEAAAAGLPVITTADNGFAETLTPGLSGEVLTDGADVDGLTAALLAWADPARCLAARPSIRANATRFTIGENLAQTLRVLAGIVPGS